MADYLDIENWKRKKHYLLFKDYADPFFNICADVDISDALRFTREHQISFFVAALYLSTRVANSIEEFRYRIRGERVIIHDTVHPSSTVLNTDETFSFCDFDYQPDFAKFNNVTSAQLKKYKQGFKSLDPQYGRDDLIYYSVIPWVSFKSFAHAKGATNNDSVPKIVFGGYFGDGNRIKMPVSVEAHHALLDGLHVGRFFRFFQEQLCEAKVLLGARG